MLRFDPAPHHTLVISSESKIDAPHLYLVGPCR